MMIRTITPPRRRLSSHLILVHIAVLLVFASSVNMVSVHVSAEDAAADPSTTASPASGNEHTEEKEGEEYHQSSAGKKDDETPNSLNDKPEDNWGYYYDPKNEFCGEYDCYKILGFDYETFGRSPPDTKMITQSYRMLSRKFHPDKNRGKEGAEERFVKINKAHKVLTSRRRRAEYDYLRDNPDEYISRYGTNVLFHYAPKSDVTMVALMLLIAANLFAWFVQKNKWQTVADHVVKLALDGVGLREGGTDESIAIREKAMEILAKQKEEGKEDGGSKVGASTNASSATGTNANAAAKVKGGSPKKKGAKLTKKEQKEQEMEELRPIVVKLVKEEHADFGGGFHQPTWRDLLITKFAQWPIMFTKAMGWQVGYWFRRLRGLELSDDELEVLTRRAVGEVTWHALSDEDRAEATKQELWVSKNLEDWREMQEVKKWGPGYQKKYNRWKKKQGSKLE